MIPIESTAAAGLNFALEGWSQDGSPSSACVSLEDVGYEVMTPVVAFLAGILVMPTAVVDRNLHLGRIAIVQAIAAAVVLVAIKILWVVNVGIVQEAIAVTRTHGATPCLAIGVSGSAIASAVVRAGGIRITRPTSAVSIDAIVGEAGTRRGPDESCRAQQAQYGLA